ncbi:MAG: anthranilate synthase component I family protein [Gaiella sp.]
MRLELHRPDGAFEQLEDWLRSHGFFAPGGESLVADLYLGYGLSQTIRRDPAPAPPEPCALPLLACVVREDGHRALHDDSADERAIGSIGSWERTWSDAAYGAAVDAVRAAIGRGDVYQVNLVQHLSASFAGSPRALATRLSALPQPRDWPLGDRGWRVLEGDGWAIVSASPELFLARRGDRVWTMPIKGTRPAGWAAELHTSAKDAAEHVMIVDLERNDLSRVCEAGTVRWPQLMATEPLAGVEHMVSLVEGRLRDGVGLAELLVATFPGGSITGAPKIAAVDVIAALEPVGRGASMGALGRVHGNGDLELALTIRTFAIADGRIHLWVGGGVVWDSDPAGELAESLTKAAPLLTAIGAPLQETDGGRGASASAAEPTPSVSDGSRPRRSPTGGAPDAAAAAALPGVAR